MKKLIGIVSCADCKTELQRSIEKPMWVAIDKSVCIQATWYHGCVQPLAKWRKAIKGLGWTARHSAVVFYL